MTATVHIRPATPDDRAAIGRLWRELMDFHHQFDDRAFALVPDAAEIWLRQLDASLTDDNCLVLVAEVEGQLVGYAVGDLSEAKPMFQHGPYGAIGTFYVTATWRRRGIGRRLVERLLAWFHQRGMPEARVTAWASNPVSNAFWRALGFQPKTIGMNLLLDRPGDSQ
jgi:GNAT superfamily N-acetyltransferase